MIALDAILIGERVVGHGCSVFVVAEAGVNHNGDLALAKRLVDAAAQAGADAVKFQTFKAEKVISRQAPKAQYQLETTGAGESQLEMARRLELPFDAFRELQAHSQARGILFMSSPFDEESADFLDELRVPAFKVGSGEVTNWPFLEYVARKGKPVILSTGMSYLTEVGEALRVIREAGNNQIALLHCVSSYPADPADANLRAMDTMAEVFHVPVGYSDHTPGIEVALAAVALGACIIEKHLTLDRSFPGPDHKASLEPEELKAMVEGIRKIEQALGSGIKAPRKSELGLRHAARRSLVAARDIPEGARIQADSLTALRPAGGIGPNLVSQVVGRKAAHSLKAGDMLKWEDLK